MIGLKRDTVKLVKHNIKWQKSFNFEAKKIRETLGKDLLDIQHIGSTAIKNILAKPIIDIGLVVSSFKKSKLYIQKLEKIGYNFKKDDHHSERMFFTKGPENKRTHYLHLGEQGSGYIEDMILFRDYLCRYKNIAKEYSRLKEKLAKKYFDKREIYTDKKEEFVSEIVKKAKFTPVTKKIFLTSGGMDIRDEIIKILPKPIKGLRVAQIITAGVPKYKGEPPYAQNDKKILELLGMVVTNIDIKGKNQKELANIFRNQDIIYAQGGNSFYLLKAMKESGFDQLVKKLIKNGVIYIGVSAGTCVACPTIEMVEWGEQDKNFVNLGDLSALNLVPFLIRVHYKPEQYKFIKAYSQKSQYAVRALTDKQAYLIIGNRVTLVGRGREHLFQ